MRKLALALLLILSIAKTLSAQVAGRAGLKNFTGAVGIAGNRTNGSDSISNVSVNGVINVKTFGAVGDNATDNSAAFAAAVAAAGASGKIYFPQGTYRWSTPSTFVFGKANCNVTLIGDSSGGTSFAPMFSSADAVAFRDLTAENPPACLGGVQGIGFVAQAPTPTSLNLIHVSNEIGILIKDVSALNFSGTGDTTVYIDTGAGPGGTTWTEQTRIIGLHSWYSNYMLVLNAQNQANTSLNNTTLIAGDCQTSGTGACILYQSLPTGFAMLNSLFEFNGDVLASGASVLRSSASASNVGPVEYHIRMQYVPGTGTGNCYDAPSGTWTVNGYVYCNGLFTATTNNVPVQTNLVGSANGGLSPANHFRGVGGNPDIFTLLDTSGIGENLTFANTAGTAFWSLNAGTGTGDTQGNFAIFDNVHGTFPLVIAPSDAASFSGALAIGGQLTSTQSAADAVGLSIHNTAASGQTWNWATSATGATQPGGVGGSCIYNQGVAWAQCWDVSGNSLVQHLWLPGLYQVGTLPACAAGIVGRFAEVTDCNANCATYKGTTQTGGGATKILVMCNGTAWEQH